MKTTKRRFWKNIALIFCAGLLSVSCTKDEDPVTDDDDPGTGGGGSEVTFDGPTYADNYTGISSWAYRSQWNLANVHDPSVTKQGDYYYMYQTDASYGNAHDGHGHFPYRRSTDLVNWEYQGAAFSETPTWIKDTLNNKRAEMELDPIETPTYGHWAPYIHEYNGVYRLYYSVVVTNPIVGDDTNTSWTERAFIGLAETTDLASNQWEDKGMVICSEPDGLESYTRTGNGDWSAYFQFNAIDPTVISSGSEEWLVYGSWHTGIAAVQLDPVTGKPYQLNSLEDYGTRIAGRGNINTNRWQALEGPEIIYNEETGYYYLFLAYDELSVAYNTRVARATSITGPYYGIDGGNVTEGAECWPMLTHPYQFNDHTGWVGFSHCSVFQDDVTGDWYYASQARLPVDVPGINVSNAVMMGHVREIEWTSDGWPVISPERYAAVPDDAISAEDIAGTWEQIIMNYQYQTMQTSTTLFLTSGGAVSGGASGNWSFNEDTNTLLIDGNECKVFNSWDWEASPRKLTLTYSGFTPEGKPIWGKLKS
ncbi:arabinan endo-1,5-alpha-L-arabinosidase [Pustulibacterium marinum]|uniref:Arabinan endo-1,5-alpha-L-arabinosidase n=1 Tax=Pustulibacterium marinum TaxID=1224947 RepID=A0A1I7HIQ1_9FLAO|nr:arabinan endo-1,5-alpha-L-arabinosidase [Pustulibacterium marinum]SFU60521.1 arabinan endo-1,5-alpha-L-arabinosidase [Pustulibacterium marinum]